MTNYTPTTNLAANKAIIIDTTAPTIDTLSPLDGASNVDVDDNLVITFTEAVDAESGNIVIYDASDDSVVETIAVGSTSGTGTATITINPTSDLATSTTYYVQIASTAFDDAAGNSFAGITDTTTWNFTTVSGNNPPEVTIDPAFVSQSTDGKGYVTFTFTIRDIDDEVTKAKVEFSTNNSTWGDPTLYSVSPNAGDATLTNSSSYQIESIDTDANDTVKLTAVWKSQSQIPDEYRKTVYIRVTPNDDTIDGTAKVSSSFRVDNKAPQINNINLKTSTPTSLTPQWTHDTSQEDYFTKYYLCYGEEKSEVTPATCLANEWTSTNDSDLTSESTTDTTITGLTGKTRYHIRLNAIDDYGNTSFLKLLNNYTGNQQTVGIRFQDITTKDRTTYQEADFNQCTQDRLTREETQYTPQDTIILEALREELNNFIKREMCLLFNICT